MNNTLLMEIEGLQTIKTLADKLGIKKQSAINLASRLKKEGYLTTTGGGRKIRFYKISTKKQRIRSPGMFDIINKYSPMKLNPWYDHQVHGKYGPEEALVDAIETKSFRAILASLRLFGHIKDWKQLRKYAIKKGCWQQTLALHELAMKYFKIRKIPSQYVKEDARDWISLTQLRERHNFPEIERRWHVYIPFNNRDMEAIS
ncbi:MAG: helix-turn-helix domain-containing protein [Candidatus Woesearchaeota archaeon]